MKTFHTIAAQGEVYFCKVDTLPDGLTAVDPTADGHLIIAHSETGHHHVMDVEDRSSPAVELFTGPNPLIMWLQVNRPTTLRHLREFDTHEPILFPVGIHAVRKAREYTPEGWRRVED